MTEADILDAIDACIEARRLQQAALAEVSEVAYPLTNGQPLADAK